MGVMKARVMRMLEGVQNPVLPKREHFTDLTDAEFNELVEEYNTQVAEMATAKAEDGPGGHTEDVIHGPGVK